MIYKNETAYSKLNLGLYIGEKKEDLHSLISIMTIFTLFSDLLSIEVITDASNSSFSESKTKILISGLEDICTLKSSTIYKATNIFLKEINANAYVRINVKKGIPSPSGLGGASSDAGLLLKLLNDAFTNPLPEITLFKVAHMVGSDVCFFLSTHKTAIITGTGETVIPIKHREDLHFRYIKPYENKVSTKDAYTQIDLNNRVRTALPSVDELADKYKKNVSEWDFENDFSFLYTKPSFPTFNNEVILLTGAGPTWFITCQKS